LPNDHTNLVVVGLGVEEDEPHVIVNLFNRLVPLKDELAQHVVEANDSLHVVAVVGKHLEVDRFHEEEAGAVTDAVATVL
jgi:hypothetical protein